MKWPFRRSPMLTLAIVGVAAVVIGFSTAVLVRRARGFVPAGVQGHQGHGSSESAPSGSPATEPSSDPVDAPVQGEKSLAEEEQGGPRLPETMIMPVNGVVVAEFGWRRDPVMDYWRFTDGIDISCLPGAQVRAVLSGKVASVERDERGILSIRLEHAGGVESYYENLRTAWVEEGDEVGQGASLGEAGVGLPSLEEESVVRFMIVNHGEFIDPVQCIGKRF